MLAAFSLVGFTLIGALLLVDQIADSKHRISDEGARTAREGNGERMLVELLLNAASSTDTSRGLRGDTLSVSFWSVCGVPGGWREPCHIKLVLDRHEDSTSITAVLQSGEAFPLRRERGAMSIRYFDSSARDSSWREMWKSNVTLPTAIALRVGFDTILYRVGGFRE